MANGNGFQSALMPRETIITDFNFGQLAPPQNMMIDGQPKWRGRVPRDWDRQPHGAGVGARVDIPLIPESEWQGRIEEMEKSKTRLSDLEAQSPFDSLDQDSTNYCWCNAVVTCLMFLRMKNNMPREILSPACVAAQVKNFSNSGGWGGEALEFMTQHGITTVDKWPANAIRRSLLTDEVRADMARRQITEWYDLESRNFAQLMTLLLNRIPVAIGLNWWSHEVAAIDPVWTSGPAVRIRNSWSNSYGDRGYNILSRSRATPDDACAPLVIESTAV